VALRERENTVKKIITRLIVGTGLAGAALGVIGAPMAIAEPVYGNCTEAREAGVTPLYEGDPGYAPHLDRDNDGVACE
jgi:hypothetical protein